MAPPTEAECLCISQPMKFNQTFPNITRNSLCGSSAKSLSEKFNQLTVGEKSIENEKNSCKDFGHQHGQWHHPKDFRQMNRLKSTAVATNSLELLDNQSSPSLKAINTTGLPELTKALNNICLASDEEEKEAKSNVENGAEEKLIERGPVPRNHRVVGYTPYQNGAQNARMGSGANGAAMGYHPTSPAYVYVLNNNNHHHHSGYQTPAEFHQSQRQKNASILPPDLMRMSRPSNFAYQQQQAEGIYYDSPQGVGSIPNNSDYYIHSPSTYSPPVPSDGYSPSQPNNFSPNSATSADTPSPCADQRSNDELGPLLNSAGELPDELTDFILKYSRRYSTDTPPTIGSPEIRSRKSSYGESISSAAADSPGTGRADTESPTATESSTCSESPRAPPSKEPVKHNANGKYKPIRPKQSALGSIGGSGKAKERLTALMPQMQKEAGWVWSVKIWNNGPKAFYWADNEGDTLLHIAVWNRDIPKIYGIVEHMKKDPHPPFAKPFDAQNRLHETPLFLAVEKRMLEVVAYLLECGADPNRRTKNHDGDAPLHYAAARGMTEIVQALCAKPEINLNLPNASGQTPLLCAVRNHGVIEEESQCLVNNKPVIRKLLAAGANPKFAELSSMRKTVLHYAVERMDPELVEVFSDNLDEASMRQLVNTPMYDGLTPIQLLNHMAGCRPSGLTRGEGEEELRRKMYATLIQCGAEPIETELSPNPDLYPTEP